VKQLSRKITKSVILLLITVLLVSSLGFINLARAQPLPSDFAIVVSLAEGTTITSNNVTLLIELSSKGVWWSLQSAQVTYYLDDQFFGQADYPPQIITTIANLTQGEHKIEIKGEGTYFGYFREMGTGKVILNPITVNFNVNSEPTQLTQQPTQTNQTTQLSGNPFSSLAMVLSGVIAGAVIVSVALLVIYRKKIRKLDKRSEETDRKDN
jgi:hypothetical protein